MKTLLLILLFCPALMAADVTLQWDDSAGAVDGYGLFDRNYQKPYNYAVPSWTGSALTGIVTVPNDRQSAFVARAYQWGPYDLQGVRTQVWSDDSNEVVWTPPVIKPAPPRNLAIRILVAIGRFFKGLFG
jgi:hypothetical protein